MKIAISPNAETTVSRLSDREQKDIKTAVTRLERLNSCEDLIRRSVRIPGEIEEIYKYRLAPRIRMLFTVMKVKEEKLVLILSFYKYDGD